MDAKPRVHTESENGIARITVDDGKVNALSAGLLREIDAALGQAEKDGAVVVLRGRPGIFSAGFDLPTFKRGTEATLEMLHAGVQAIERLLGLRVPVLAVCTGHAYPMGAFLLLASDVRFAAAGDFRIGLNETAIGLTLPQFAVELTRHRLTPNGFARVPTGMLYDPEEARRLGFVDRVLDAGRLDDEAAREAERLRGLSPEPFAATKARVNAQVIEAVAAARAELDR